MVRAPSRSFVVYLVGIILLGAFYQPLKDLTRHGLVFLLVGFSYLVLLRGLGFWLDRRRSPPKL
jgi:hypothetical protein